VEFRLLGPVELHTSAGPVKLGTPRERHVVAVLAAEAGRTVPIGTLIDRVWGPDAPGGAPATLRVYLAHIRKVLDKANSDAGRPAALVRRPGGYLLDVAADQVDLCRFRVLVARARDPGCPEHRRAELLREALDLVAGEPLADLSGEWADRVRQAWSREHVEAALGCARVLLGSDPGAAVVLLGGLADRYPLNESVAAALMRALHAAGRSAEALQLYADVRDRLADQLGIDPGAELQDVHRRILRGEPVIPPRPVPSAAGAVPAQLPADPPGFVGRTEHLDGLDALLAAAADRTTTRVAAIDGTAGVGKTALALHWAHRVADRFPEGQLYLNLRGFDPGGQVTDPVRAVRLLLDALGVPPRQIPTDLDAQTALYRSVVTGRRMLIVLDNARDSVQVEPLLPGAPGCLVLVTSRNRLTSLVATAGAQPLPVELLTDAEARQLLSRRLGDRVAAEPEATEEIVVRCARLPLALTLVAAHAALRPRTRLAVLAEQLRDTQHRWQTLTGDSPTADVRTVFSWSYRALTADAARLFRLLGRHPGPDLTVPAAASLTAWPPAAVRPPLAELTRANLVVEHVPGRYTLHDLLRAYAADLSTTTDPSDGEATGRILDHYVHSAHAADNMLYPAEDPLVLASPRPGVVPETPADNAAALDWFTAEHAVLVAAVEHAAANGLAVPAWQLAGNLSIYLHRRGHWHDWLRTARVAVDATAQTDEPIGQALANRNLGRAYLRLGRFDEGEPYLSRALELTTRAGEPVAQAHVHSVLSYLWQRRGQYPQAVAHAENALRLFRVGGHLRGQADILNQIAWCQTELGDYPQAVSCCQQALALNQQFGDPHGRAATLDTLGYAHAHLGEHGPALACYTQALALAADIGNRYYEAEVHSHLGDTHRALGDTAAAREAYRRALTIFEDLDHPDAGSVRAKLNELEPVPTDQP